MAYQKKELLLEVDDVLSFIRDAAESETLYCEDRDGEDVEAFCDHACIVTSEQSVYIHFVTGQRFKLQATLTQGEEAPV